jgi:hypothetical protein
MTRACSAKLPKAVVEAFKGAQRPLMIVGGGVLAKDGAHGDTLALVETLGLVKDGWNGYNVLHFAAARMGGLMLGFATQGGIKAIAAASPSCCSRWARTRWIIPRSKAASRSMSAIMATRAQARRT